jgi:hypothetical protein
MVLPFIGKVAFWGLPWIIAIAVNVRFFACTPFKKDRGFEEDPEDENIQ